MKQRLAGKEIVITGAAGGIGSQVARELVETQYASCILVDRNAAELTRLTDELNECAKQLPRNAPPVRVISYEVDLSIPSEIRDLVRLLQTEPIAGLINNAGIAHAGPFGSASLDLFQKTIDVNLMAAVHLTRQLLPQLIENRGSIVNVASGAGLVAPAGLTAYAASKFALVGFSAALRAELRGKVAVSTICPAFVATSLVQNSMSDDEPCDASQRARTEEIDRLVKRIGSKPEKVSAAIIRALKEGPGIVPLSATTRLLWGANKILPNAVGYLNHRLFRKAVKDGIFDA